MEYIIGIILVIIVLIIVGLIFRKRMYDKVDTYESWKIDIMNRNIASELARVKTLNLSGETEKKFEQWQERWEEIVTQELSDVEDYLFDAEDAADHYRFPRAQKILTMIEETLDSIENDIKQILDELDELLQSEKESREVIKKAIPEIEQLRSHIQKHSDEFGRANKSFLQTLKEMENEIGSYDELVETGNYSEASKISESINDRLKSFKELLDQYPDILNQCEKEVPETLDQLLNGIKEMETQGYHVRSLNVIEEIRTTKSRLREFTQSLETADLEEVKQFIKVTKNRIDEIYDELEEEALAKNYVDQHYHQYQSSLTEMNEVVAKSEATVEQLEKTYYVEVEQVETLMSLKKSMTSLNEHLKTLDEQLTDKKVPHTVMQSQLELSLDQLQQLKADEKKFTEQIHRLRKDELEAKGKLSHLETKLKDIQRRLKRSNLPGIPTFIWELFETAHEKQEQVGDTLKRQPLDISIVKQSLEEAEKTVEQVEEQVDILIEQAELTEHVIQYANRYRSQNPILAARLSESERLFRTYDYELALEEAAAAIEEIEPGALKHIETVYNEQVKD